MTVPTRPYFNHAAFTVDGALLDGEAKADLCAFYGEVFGWQEMPTMSTPGQQLVFRCRTFEEFVFLIAGAEPTRAAEMDHIGISVADRAEVAAHRDRALAFASKDDRVEVTELTTEEFPAVVLTSFYTRFLLPVRIEVQHYEVEPAAQEYFWSVP